jgi:hypothetical protein
MQCTAYHTAQIHKRIRSSELPNYDKPYGDSLGNGFVIREHFHWALIESPPQYGRGTNWLAYDRLLRPR